MAEELPGIRDSATIARVNPCAWRTSVPLVEGQHMVARNGETHFIRELITPWDGVGKGFVGPCPPILEAIHAMSNNS